MSVYRSVSRTRLNCLHKYRMDCHEILHTWPSGSIIINIFFFFFHQQQVKVSICSSFSPPGQSDQLQLWPTLCFCVHGTHYVHQDVNITSMNNASMLAVAVNSKHQCAYRANIYSTCNQQTSSHKVKTVVGGWWLWRIWAPLNINFNACFCSATLGNTKNVSIY